MMKNLFTKAKKNQKGFTLVELMVVVVIIGILTAIAVPVYNTTQAKAKATACEANIRIIKSAIQQAELNGDQIQAGTIGGSSEGDESNETGLEDYFESTPVCPFGSEYKYSISGDASSGYTIVHDHNPSDD